MVNDTVCPVCRTNLPEYGHAKECVLAYVRQRVLEKHKPHDCSLYRKLAAHV